MDEYTAGDGFGGEGPSDLRDDLGDLPEYFRTSLGPAGEEAMDHALEMGYGNAAAVIVGNAARAAAWNESEDEFSARMLSLPGREVLLFQAMSELLRHENLWPWRKSEAE